MNLNEELHFLFIQHPELNEVKLNIELQKVDRDQMKMTLSLVKNKLVELQFNDQEYIWPYYEDLGLDDLFDCAFPHLKVLRLDHFHNLSKFDLDKIANSTGKNLTELHLLDFNMEDQLSVLDNNFQNLTVLKLHGLQSNHTMFMFNDIDLSNIINATGGKLIELEMEDCQNIVKR